MKVRIIGELEVHENPRGAEGPYAGEGNHYTGSITFALLKDGKVKKRRDFRYNGAPEAQLLELGKAAELFSVKKASDT